jgi:hypothetical protein
VSDNLKYIDPQEFIDVGFLQEANRKFFHPLGLALQVDPESGEMKVWDYREEPEGIVFANGVIAMSKIHAVAAERSRHLSTRRKLFGSAIQNAGQG